LRLQDACACSAKAPQAMNPARPLLLVRQPRPVALRLLAEDSRQNAFSLIVAAYAKRDLARYPVNASELLQSRMTIRVCQAQDHLTRQLVIREIRLSAWESGDQSRAEEGNILGTMIKITVGAGQQLIPENGSQSANCRTMDRLW
jgi:hypothetical protein